MTTLEFLKEINQPHIIQAYQNATPQQQKHLDSQINSLNSTYPGGLKQYYHRSLQLLEQSANSSNPYEAYKICVPKGIHMDFNDSAMTQKYQTIGMKQIPYTVFVLVAGGLGERLGYPGIKIAIPIQLITGKTFLQYYIEYILAFQKKYCKEGVKLPLLIMTSDDTNSQTIQFLQENKYFGMDKSQLTIVKQQKVPAITNSKAHFSLLKDKLEIQTKPHGHGDIHTLIYQHNLVQNWSKEGRKWVIFFQDTNPLAFRSFTALLGITAEQDYDFNSIGVPRKPGEAVGAITSLQHKDTGKSLTINVEYNQLEGLFKESGGEKTNEKGFSILPGNTNCFVIKISQYQKVLEATKGTISQFINPKYSDQTKTNFKSSARLQCMMQDYPKLLPSCDKVGFTSIEKIFCYTTAKNDPASALAKYKTGISPQSAGSCQAELYRSNRQILRQCGAEIPEAQPVQFGDIKLNLFPIVSISPIFATCITEMRQKVKKLKISPHSSLVLASDSILDDVEVDGHAEIKNQGNISIKILDKNYMHVIGSEPNDLPYIQIRKYKIQK